MPEDSITAERFLRTAPHLPLDKSEDRAERRSMIQKTLRRHLIHLIHLRRPSGCFGVLILANGSLKRPELCNGIKPSREAAGVISGGCREQPDRCRTVDPHSASCWGHHGKVTNDWPGAALSTPGAAHGRVSFTDQIWIKQLAPASPRGEDGRRNGHISSRSRGCNTTRPPG